MVLYKGDDDKARVSRAACGACPGAGLRSAPTESNGLFPDPEFSVIMQNHIMPRQSTPYKKKTAPPRRGVRIAFRFAAVTALLAAYLVIALSGCRPRSGNRYGPYPVPVVAKNVILIIGDGMDLASEVAASRYLYGTDDGLAWHDSDRFTYRGYCTTWDVTTYNGYASGLGKKNYGIHDFSPSVGYDISKGGAKPYPTFTGGDNSYFFSGYAADSASSATAMATGKKTDTGNIAWESGDPAGGAIVSITDLAKKRRNASIGIVTTFPFNHATPASFASHNPNRYNLYTGYRGYAGHGVADEIITAVKPKVVIGGGHPAWDNPAFDATKGNISKELYDGLKDGAYGYTFVERESSVDGGVALQAAAGNTNASEFSRLFGLFGGNTSIFEPPVPSDNGSAIVTPGSEENPTLAEASIAALTVLSKNPNGFFLMVEQGDIDWANHRNNYHWMIGAMWDLEQAVKAVCGFIDDSDTVNWSNTLVIVTADHAVGFLRFNPSITMTRGDLPTMEGADYSHTYPDGEITYGTTSHTNELVTVSAAGAGAWLFHQYEGSWYPGRKIIDNTHIFKVMSRAMGLSQY